MSDKKSMAKKQILLPKRCNYLPSYGCSYLLDVKNQLLLSKKPQKR